MWYIDSSAIIKLIKPEKESAALIKKLPRTLIASRISRVEVTRTIIRYEPDLLDETYDVFAAIQMVPVEDAIIRIAENLPQFIDLRSLDSLHIASALGKDIETVYSVTSEFRTGPYSPRAKIFRSKYCKCQNLKNFHDNKISCEYLASNGLPRCTQDLGFSC